MGENSHISWTDHTHNAWIGCTKISAGCDNCYAEREQDIRYGRARWGKGNTRYRTSEANRRKPFSWDRKAAAEGRRYKVFTASLSDVFDEEVPDEWRDELFFETIAQTCHLDWLVLTKRVSKMLRYVKKNATRLPRNIWWGCSIEDQAAADQRLRQILRVRELLLTEAIVWVSVEPLLGPIDLDLTGVDWVIVGGESGPRARPMQVEWARALRDRCVEADVAFHFKQWGEHDIEGVRVGKKTAGRTLDGQEWNAAPLPLLT